MRHKIPNFAKAVRDLRKSYGQSQRDFAADCHVSQPGICDIEGAKYDPGVRALIKIGEATDCDVVLNAKNGKIFVPR